MVGGHADERGERHQGEVPDDVDEVAVGPQVGLARLGRLVEERAAAGVSEPLASVS